MVARSETLTRPDRGPALVAAAAVAAALFVGAWALLHVGFYRHKQVLDTPIYQRYGNAIARGAVPYRDFSVEYPPGALPVFALPGLAEPGRDQQVTVGFRHAFETLMWICGVAVLAAMAYALRAVEAGGPRVWGSLVFAALAPLLLGSVVLSRFDLWPVALAAGALAALVSGWRRLGSGLLGVALAAKLYPVVLVPLALAHVWRRWGRREALVCAAISAAVVAALFAPFVALAPDGVRHSLTGQLGRPLQIETLGSALLLAAHHIAGLPVAIRTSHGSQNVVASGAGALAVVQTVLQIAALVWIWSAFARGPARREELLRSSAAAICAFVALGKVLSPQFLIWLIPLVPLVRGRRGLWASGLLGLALVLTQLWFPFRYWNLVDQLAGLPSWLVLARDVTLLALLAVLTLPSRSHVVS